MIESCEDLLHLAAIGLHRKRLALVVNQHIAEDATLRIQQESIHAPSCGKIANVVRNHAVHPAHAIAASK